MPKMMSFDCKFERTIRHLTEVLAIPRRYQDDTEAIPRTKADVSVFIETFTLAELLTLCTELWPSGSARGYCRSLLGLDPGALLEIFGTLAIDEN